MNPLNPEAGAVPVPHDPIELNAALRAGRISWRLFPYYDWRYGERGAAFTRSDSAWLVTLCRGSREQVVGQVQWLGPVLSSRGMPQWLLEVHLKVLYRQLSRMISGQDDKYRKLLAAAEALENERLRRISQQRFHRLSRDFAARVAAPSSGWALGTGHMLVAAVADERSGIDGAVDSLADWLKDPVHFDEARARQRRMGTRRLLDVLTPALWQRAVEETVRRARRS